MPIPNQPTLPAEGNYTDVERLFIQEQPPNLWPDNQNSNFGALRRVLTNPLQDAVDQIVDMFNEMFIATSNGWLGRWEKEYGLPAAPSSVDLETRRAIAGARAIKGKFTRARRRWIVERFIRATFGSPIELIPPGVPIPPEGLPIYAEYTDISRAYNIVETVTDFYYEVRILAAYTADPGLERELKHFTPAGIRFDINYYATEAELFA